MAFAALAAAVLVAPSADAQSLTVQNPYFSSPSGAVSAPQDTIPGAPTSWTQTAQPGYYSSIETETGIPWAYTVGVFGNTTPYITNDQGPQAGYILNFQGNGLSQSLSTNYTVGTPYTLNVGLAAGEYVQPTDSIDLILYYGSNMTILGDTSIPGSAFSYPDDLTTLQDFSVSIPAVQAGDPEAGQPIGIEILSTNGVDGGFWNVGNVSVVPEPATIGLLAFGLGALGLRRRRAAC